jgi:hypothetical protein
MLKRVPAAGDGESQKQDRILKFLDYSTSIYTDLAPNTLPNPP